MGGHFFCLPIADGECWGGAVPDERIPLLLFFAAKYMRFLCQLEKMIYFCG